MDIKAQIEQLATKLMSDEAMKEFFAKDPIILLSNKIVQFS